MYLKKGKYINKPERLKLRTQQGKTFLGEYNNLA